MPWALWAVNDYFFPQRRSLPFTQENMLYFWQLLPLNVKTHTEECHKMSCWPWCSQWQAWNWLPAGRAGREGNGQCGGRRCAVMWWWHSEGFLVFVGSRSMESCMMHQSLPLAGLPCKRINLHQSAGRGHGPRDNVFVNTSVKVCVWFKMNSSLLSQYRIWEREKRTTRGCW